MLDIVVLEEIYPKNLCWIAKKEIADLPVIGQIIHIPQMISVERENKRSLIKLVKDAQDRVEKGRFSPRERAHTQWSFCRLKAVRKSSPTS